jgi:cytochrome c-type biogenesis protein CcsB
MTSLLRFLAAGTLLVAALPAPAADYYVADTGRTAHTEVSTSAAMSILGEDASAAGHDHDHDHAAHDGDPHEHESAPLMEMSSKQLYDPAVEAAVLASGVDKIGLQNEGVERTLRTFAEIQVNAVTGKTKYEGMDPVYLVLGMIYQNMSWARVPMIPVENAELAKAWGLDPKTHNRVSSVWVMKTPAARMMVMSKLQGMDSPQAAALSDDASKALNAFAFRLGTFLNLPGELKVIPMAGKSDVWIAPLHLERPELLTNVDADLAKDVASIDKTQEPYKSLMALDAALKKAYNEQQPQEVASATSTFLAAADATPGYTTALKRQMDYIQTAVHPFKRSGQLFMLAFFVFLVYLLMLRKKKTDFNSTDRDGGSGLVDGRTEEYGHAPANPFGGKSVSPAAPGVLDSALRALQPAPAMAMSGSIDDAGALPGAGFGSGAADGAFDNTGSRNYGDPVSTALLETPRGSRVTWGIGFALMLGATVALVFALANRAYLGGRMPVSNMYESITFAMGAFALVSVVYEAIHRRAWVGIGASFAGWVLMTMANSMSLQARKIDPLVAVLNSVWLNFHVTSLLISYSCFLLAFVTGILFLIKDMTGNRPGVLPRAETFEFLTYRCVQIGWPLLTLGIFLGGVWANTAWGSFWSWDPKETWALITWLTYTIYLHLRINLGWNGRKSIYASMIGFGMVLLTYFGVSYLPGLAGGMHSYAEPIQR